MLGQKSKYAEECFKANFIGADYGFVHDLTNDLKGDYREFKKLIPQYLSSHPGKTKIAAGLACGFLFTIAKGIQKGDVVVCPNGEGKYYVGEVISDYIYTHGGILPHRRTVQWLNKTIDRSEMSQSLKNSTGSIGTVSSISKYSDELEKLIGVNTAISIINNGELVEDPAIFALEKHLEEFLIHNWAQTELGKKYDIYSEENELVGQQYPSDTGPIDILAISKDKKELLIVELKKGRASDNVVGQVQRYMGFAKEELAEEGQLVKGVIIALEDDIRIRRALSVTHNIEFYRYEISFKLFKS